MEERRIYTLGLMLEHVYADSIGYWRSKYAPSLSLADCLGGPINNVNVEVNFLPRGRADVTCTIDARRGHETETYFFRAVRKGPNDWIIVGSSFNLY